MKIAPRFERQPRYLKAIFSGDAALAESVDMMQLVRHSTIEFGDTRLLVDLRQLHESFQPDDEVKLGLHLVKAFAHLQKVASLVPPGRRTRTSEKAAGPFPFRVFVSEDEAVAWLLE
jgi:hypothetical protein